jgi:hypothetical protein
VVADDIENDTEAIDMGRIDELSELVGSPIQVRRRKQIHPVVTPPEAAVEFGHGHQFDDRHAEPRQLRQLLGGRLPGAFKRESPGVQFVDNLTLKRDAGPLVVTPLVRERIDDLRRFVGAFRLPPRTWSGYSCSESSILNRYRSPGPASAVTEK